MLQPLDGPRVLSCPGKAITACAIWCQGFPTSCLLYPAGAADLSSLLLSKMRNLDSNNKNTNSPVPLTYLRLFTCFIHGRDQDPS